MIPILWELRKTILKKGPYPGNETFGKMTPLVTKGLQVKHFIFKS
jgi:hypothetical protein